jgi:hypothetical protein
MPYIRKDERELRQGAQTPGELAYVLYAIVLDWTHSIGFTYSTAATAIGVLETVKAEFQRQCLNPYEDRKKADNGDVTVDEALAFVAKRLK